jgi:hypothetical protein
MNGVVQSHPKSFGFGQAHSLFRILVFIGECLLAEGTDIGKKS